MDFKLFIDSLLAGTPVAILVALVGIVWQAIYVHSRDKTRDKQIKRDADLEDRRFQHQRDIEGMRFEHEQSQWREDLAR